MTNEIEKQFFDTFGIEPVKYKRNVDDNAMFMDKVYPQITDSILLELICIIGAMYICVQDKETLKEHILVQCMMHSEEIKHQVRAIFKERN